MVNAHPAPTAALWPESIKSHWKLFLVEGIVLVILGIGAILVPVLATLAVSIFLGWLFLVGGIVGAVTTLMGRHAPGFWWSLISAIITIVAGLPAARRRVSLTVVPVAIWWPTVSFHAFA